MKSKILGLLIIIFGIALIAVGTILGYDEDTKKTKPKTEEQQIHKDYKELGPQTLKDDQMFDNIKYTQNHLSSTSDTYATFTSVVFNETGKKLTHLHLEIDFYDESNNLIATIPSEIEDLDVNASTVIFGMVEKNLTTAQTFKVRQVTSE